MHTCYNFLYFVSTEAVHAPHIPSYLLDTPITDHDIAIIARDYLVSWEELLPYKKLTIQQEHGIQETVRRYEDQKREALRMWKRNEGSGATYGAFITAAETTSNMQLADNVRALLKERLQHTSTGVLGTYKLILLYRVHITWVGPWPQMSRSNLASFGNLQASFVCVCCIV